MFRILRFSGSLPFLAALAVAGLLLSGQHLGRFEFVAGQSFKGTSWSNQSLEEATPDSDMTAAEPLPANQRERLLARLGVERWHKAGFTGKGVKIAVLDTGFRGYRDHLGKALPPQVSARSFRPDGDLEAKSSQHGILCCEVVHTLAPEAEILVANWDTNNPETFLDAVRWAKREGARIITCSIIMPTWSDGEGGGAIHQKLAVLVGSGKSSGDLLCFASAGNTAQRHWFGPFRGDRDGYHQWETGQTRNLLKPWQRGSMAVELYGQPGASYELVVIDSQTGAEVVRAASRQEGNSCAAVAQIQVRTPATYDVEVRLVDGRPGSFHMVALGGSLSRTTSSGSIPFPGDGAEVVAVAAVTSEEIRAPYSSCGPNSRQPKPDLAAPVPFPSQWRAKPFSGTSAAAPQAAALAALWWSRQPHQSASQVRSVLCRSALDLLQPGHDVETGFGLVHLPDENTRPAK